MSQRRQRGQRGSALLEGAFIFTILMMLLFGILDLCRLVWWYNGVSYLAREGTRYAAVRGNSSVAPATAGDVTNAVTAQAIGYDSANFTIATTWIPDNKPGSAVKVIVTYPFTPIVPYVPPGTISLSSTSQLTITQ